MTNQEIKIQVPERRERTPRQHRRWAKWFLWVFAIRMVVYGRNDWEDTLVEDIKDSDVLPVLAILTHDDYLNGPEVRVAVPSDMSLAVAALFGGFNNEEHGGDKGRRVRNWFLNKLFYALYLTRTSPKPSEIKRISQQRSENRAVLIFPTGNRRLREPLLGGATVVMTKGTDRLYPGVMLGERKPVYPSGSKIWRNVWETLKRLRFGLAGSMEFIKMMEPISKTTLLKISKGKSKKEKRKNSMRVLEVLRAYGSLQLFLEVGRDRVLRGKSQRKNPLLKNKNNVFFLQQCVDFLSEGSEYNWEVEVLVKNGYISENLLNQLRGLEFDE